MRARRTSPLSGGASTPSSAVYARRFTVQERIGQEVVNTGVAEGAPHGAAVLIEAHHLCVQTRGVRESAATTRTTMWRGEYAESAATRSESVATCGANP